MLTNLSSLQYKKNSFEKKINLFMRRFYYTYWGRWIWSLLSSFFIFVLTDQLTQKVFYTNDDENIMYTLAGYYTNGVPQDHSFVNSVLAHMIGGVYSIFPMLPWYGIFHVVILGACTVIIFKVTLEYGEKRGVSFFCCNFLAFLGYSIIIMYPSILLQFTTTSACAGAAAILLILGIDLNDEIKRKIFEEVLAVFFVLICYMHRKNSGLVVFCFYFSTLFYQWVKGYIISKKNSKAKKYMRSFVICTLVTIISVTIVQIVSDSIRSSDTWKNFYEYDEARYKMTDYKHDTYSENPELYNKIGWTEELYDLGGTYWWFFMDERINSDAFRTISETGYYNTSFDLMDAWKRLLQLFEANPITTAYLISAINLFLLYVIVIAEREKRNIFVLIEFVYLICMMGGAFILCMYLCIMGRFIQRAFHAIAIPYLSISYFLLVKNMLYTINAQKLGKKILQAYVVPLSIILWGVFQIWTTATLEVESRIRKSNDTICIENYAINNPDNIYIYDVSLTFRYLPFVKYQDRYPSNLFFWGGVGWNSPSFFEQLRINGLNDLYIDNLLDDNVYYITKDDYTPENRSMLHRMCSLMVSEYPECQVELIEKLPNNINVYRFFND